MKTLILLALLFTISCQKEKIAICYHEKDFNKDTLISIEGTEKYVNEQIELHPEWKCDE